MNKSVIIWTSVGLILLGGFLWLRVKLLNSRKNYQNTQSPMTNPMKQVFQGTKYERMIPLMLAQQKHESNNFRSRVFLEQNNPFGMKEAKIRDTTDVDTGLIKGIDRINRNADSIGYSEYPNLLEASKDYLLYLQSVNFPVVNNADEYAAELKSKNYYEDSFENYVRGIKYWLNN